ncbi:hypothetical protein KQX54_019965 [Cotesia glomerata]|uniref:Uncharacterized protein n=1 Tax=Cotesia glomerata TaxID=32391 RepID=A0AAV7IHJ7_COTGL|nr:hypothetical protein KQX54_019965 [Cotesia glomerata]
MKIELTPKQLYKMNYRLMKDPAKESNIHQTPQRRYLGFNLNSRDVRLKPAKLRQTRGYLAADLFDTLKRLGFPGDYLIIGDGRLHARYVIESMYLILEYCPTGVYRQASIQRARSRGDPRSTHHRFSLLLSLIVSSTQISCSFSLQASSIHIMANIHSLLRYPTETGFVEEQKVVESLDSRVLSSVV